MPKVVGSGAALFDYARGGPQFGADGLLIGPPLAPVMGSFAGPDTNSGIRDLRQAKSRLGLPYAKREDGKESLFGDESRAEIVEVQVSNGTLNASCKARNWVLINSAISFSSSRFPSNEEMVL